MVVSTSPDIVLMDLRMPVMDGVEATRRINQLGKGIKVIVLTTFDDDETIFEGLRAGAVGYLLKDVSSEKLVEAIQAVVSEFSRISKPARRQKEENIPDPLSAREIEILRIVATGASNKEIADQLFISEGTVKNHLSSILSKLGVRDRMQAILKAREYGIIDL